jgi:four helix bundle protein
MAQPAQRFQDLIVWQKSHELALSVYRLTTQLPNHELYGLTSQMRRAAVSIPANIAEGFKRRKRPDKARMMNIAEGSLEELRYYFVLAVDLGYLQSAVVPELLGEVARMLGAYSRALLSPDSCLLS